MKKKIKKILKVIIVALILMVITVILGFISHVISELFPNGTLAVAIICIFVMAYSLVEQNEQGEE